MPCLEVTCSLFFRHFLCHSQSPPHTKLFGTHLNSLWFSVNTMVITVSVFVGLNIPCLDTLTRTRFSFRFASRIQPVVVEQQLLATIPIQFVVDELCGRCSHRLGRAEVPPASAGVFDARPSAFFSPSRRCCLSAQ